MLPEPVLTVNRNRPSRLISTQHGAAWSPATGEAQIDVSVPSRPTPNADTLPLLAPPCAFETNSWPGLVGRNSLPNGPGPCAANGDLAAGTMRPSKRTWKLSISDEPTRAPTRFEPVELNKMSPGCDPSGSGNVEPGNGSRGPRPLRRNPV